MKLKMSAEEFLGHPVESAVIPVPVYFNDDQRQAIKIASKVHATNMVFDWYYLEPSPALPIKTRFWAYSMKLSPNKLLPESAAS